MTRMVFPNLPVGDLEKAKSFYAAIGFENNPEFTDENSAAAVVSDTVVIMLLSPGFAAEHGLAAPGGAPTTSLAFSADSREEVDALVEKALGAWGTLRGEPADLGFMYSRGVTDPDGHILDFVWMDPSAFTW